MDFQHGHRQEQQQMNTGLTRYRSAPSSYFTSFLDATPNTISSSGGNGSGGIGIDGFSMDDIDLFLNKFMPNNNAQGQESNPSNSFSNSMSMQSQTQLVKQEQEASQSQQPPLQHQNIQNDYSQVSQMMYRSQASAKAEVQAQRNHNSGAASNASAIDYSNKLLSSMNSNRLPPIKMATGGGNSNLVRYNSSPAGLFANINIENEYGAMRGTGNFGAGNNANAEASFSSASRFKGFSSGQSSSGLMSPISEIETKGMGESNSANRNFEGGHRDDGGYAPGFPVSSWNDSTMFSDNFLKGLVDDDKKTFSNVPASDNQASEAQNNPPPSLLSRHLSLPNTSGELSAMETLMQDSVLCKIRAKRGCATHPRSIAERVRRTRISERMRKLQELVPNMDKQTNTSDMLDLAVDYIKDLQLQVKTLSDNRTKCTCSNE